MPKRIVLQTVLLTRNGQTVRPAINAPFDFTDAELNNIEKLNPDAIKKIVASDAAPTEASFSQSDVDAQVAKAVADALASKAAEEEEAKAAESKSTAKSKSTSKSTSDDSEL